MKNNGPLLVLIGSLFFSTSGTFQSLAPSGASPVVIIEARMLIGFLGLLAWSVLAGKLPSNYGLVLWKYIFSFVVFLLGFQLLFFSSMKVVGVAVGTVASIASTPIWTAVLEKLFYKKNPPPIWYLSTVLAIAGIFLLNIDCFKSKIPLLYLTLPIIAGLCYAFEIIISKKSLQDITPEAGMMFSMGFAALLIFPFIFFFPLDWVATPRGFGVCLGLGLVTAAAAFALFYGGASKISSAMASTIGLAEPTGAAILGIFFLKEPASIYVYSGILIIILSILLLIIYPSKK